MAATGILALAMPAGTQAFPRLGNPAPVAKPVEIIQIQSADQIGRIGRLEEQIRRLNGRIEELGFQMLQMQEQMRQMQQDNEFRFQDLENGTANQRGDAGSVIIPAPPVQTTENNLPGVTVGTQNATGNEQVNLGSIRFDQNGNPISGTANSPTNILPADGAQPVIPAGPTTPTGNETAALTSPEDVYQSSYNAVLTGDYAVAEQGFRRFLDAFPGSPQAPDAHFWLGESQFSQGKYNDSARTFLTAHKEFPTSGKAPEMLLKLGMSLAGLNNRDTACATYREVLVRYPNVADATRAKVTAEQRKINC